MNVIDNNTITSNNSYNTENTIHCPICFSDNESLIKLNCKHLICQTCFVNWHIMQKKKNCTMCRRKIKNFCILDDSNLSFSIASSPLNSTHSPSSTISSITNIAFSPRIDSNINRNNQSRFPRFLIILWIFTLILFTSFFILIFVDKSLNGAKILGAGILCFVFFIYLPIIVIKTNFIKF